MKRSKSVSKLTLRTEMIAHLRPLVLHQIQGGVPKTNGTCDVPNTSAVIWLCRPSTIDGL